MKTAKSKWSLLILILSGIVLGGFLGQLLGDLSAFGWLNFGQTFGLASPVVLDLGILTITFALTIRITIAGILGMVIAILIYRLL
ncbi:MAG: DUF4321 domain-containing protein [Lachnospiraceae bacterium]|jgi:hypothetical protein|nr:DUF4321 domain-containing protein [Lachnospiraceae bacterium]